MPELPEVETVKRGLEKLVIGKKISDVSFDWHKAFPNSPDDVSAFLKGATITAIRRRAKVLIIDLDTRYSLVIHLKMTGQIVFIGKQRFGAGHPNESLIANLPDKSTRVIITFTDETHLYFNDQRKFGWMRLLPTDHINDLEFFKKLGPEPLDSSFTSNVFISRMRKRKASNVKAVLLDQSILAGVGNIYADESLWGAYIHPTKLVADLTNEQFVVLHEQLLYVLRLSIDKGGSTDKNYVNAEGKKGSYIQFARVFRREGQACYRCQSVILKTRVAGRGTHICEVCQVAPQKFS